jgi:hypothetical protein
MMLLLLLLLLLLLVLQRRSSRHPVASSYQDQALAGLCSGCSRRVRLLRAFLGGQTLCQPKKQPIACVASVWVWMLGET